MLTLGHLLTALTGSRVAGGDQVITDAVIDSRMVIPGALFVALPGERTDGHLFLGEAFRRGAAAAIVQREAPEAGGQGEAVAYQTIDLRRPLTDAGVAGIKIPVCLRVDDSLAALQTAARYWRGQVSTRVIGVTGSVGKTTTKEMIAAVLGARYRTLKNEGNLNNEIGVPLTLLRLTEAHERTVLELGFYTLGEIAFLCEIARPHIGVLTNVYPVHLERAGSLEDILRGKGELVEALPEAPAGVAILNWDEPRVKGMAARTRARVVSYGLDPTADVWASHIEGLGLEGIRFRLHYRNETLHLRAPLLGRHSVHTVLRATAVGLVEGLTWQEIIEGLQGHEAQSQLRLSAVTGPGGSLILDDSYNASPESVTAALNLLKEMDARRRIAVLGDMLELGEYEQAGHRLVGRRAREVADILVTVGRRARTIADEALQVGMKPANVVQMDEGVSALAYLLDTLREGDVVLVKGSHGLRLDRLVLALEMQA